MFQNFLNIDLLMKEFLGSSFKDIKSWSEIDVKN